MKSRSISSKEQLLYTQFARYYDLSYAWKDYAKDVEQVKEQIRELKRSDGNRLLEVACGTGNFLTHLSSIYSCTGVDISRSMLEIAKRKKIPQVEFKQVNMVGMSLGEKFDVVLCLFGSIAYVRTYRNLRTTINGFSEHLNSGGVVIIEPWFVYPSQKTVDGETQLTTEYLYKPGIPYIRVHDAEEVKIARVRNSTLRGYIQTLHIHTVIAEKDKPVVYFFDKHQAGLFDINRTIEIMQNAGLETHFDQKLLSGTFVGIKRD